MKKTREPAQAAVQSNSTPDNTMDSSIALLPAQELNRAVRALNKHHMHYGAGFYGSRIGGRYNKARARAGVLEVFDWEKWTPVSAELIEFYDHNGHNISLD